jgi:hypothetical protein
MHYKVKGSISPLISETHLFPASSGCRAYCDRFISLEDSEDAIDFILISRQALLRFLQSPE